VIEAYAHAAFARVLLKGGRAAGLHSIAASRGREFPGDARQRIAGQLHRLDRDIVRASRARPRGLDFRVEMLVECAIGGRKGAGVALGGNPFFAVAARRLTAKTISSARRSARPHARIRRWKKRRRRTISAQVVAGFEPAADTVEAG